MILKLVVNIYLMLALVYCLMLGMSCTNEVFCYFRALNLMKWVSYEYYCQLGKNVLRHWNYLFEFLKNDFVGNLLSLRKKLTV